MSKTILIIDNDNRYEKIKRMLGSEWLIAGLSLPCILLVISLVLLISLSVRNWDWNIAQVLILLFGLLFFLIPLVIAIFCRSTMSNRISVEIGMSALRYKLIKKTNLPNSQEEVVSDRVLKFKKNYILGWGLEIIDYSSKASGFDSLDDQIEKAANKLPSGVKLRIKKICLPYKFPQEWVEKMNLRPKLDLVEAKYFLIARVKRKEDLEEVIYFVKNQFPLTKELEVNELIQSIKI